MKVRILFECEIDNESEEFNSIMSSIMLRKPHHNVQWKTMIPFSLKGFLHHIRNVTDVAIVSIDEKLGMFGTQEKRALLKHSVKVDDEAS